MASFDIITAVAWSLATAPIDASEDQGYYVEGAMGTEATCTAQAFFIQLGFTSIFYNVSLGIYYTLVVAYGWKEFQLRRIRVYMHIGPLLVGFGLAFGAIASYHWFEYGCHILPTSDGPLWQVLVFVILPLGISIGAITFSMFLVYWKVRSQAAKTKKWSFGVGKASKLEQAVFWQCFYYVLAFYISWPILFAVYLFSIDENGPFGLALTVAALVTNAFRGTGSEDGQLVMALFSAAEQSLREAAGKAILLKCWGCRNLFPQDCLHLYS